MDSNDKKIVSEEVLFESEAKTKLGVPYLSVINYKYDDDSDYTFARRVNKDSLKFILIDTSKNLVGVLDSVKPLKEDIKAGLSVFGESLDEPNENRKKALSRGLIEEAGFEPTSVRVKKVGDFLISSSSDEVATLYIVDVAKAIKTERALEEGEKAHTTIWLSKESDILERCDPLVQTAYLHLKVNVPTFKLD
jgi:hypothetical protein